MRVLLSWLQEYVDITDPPEVLAEQLPMLGLGVETWERGDGDVIFDLEIASNRPDLLSLIGIARELAAWRRRQVRLPVDTLEETDPPCHERGAVEIVDPVLCPRYVAHVISDVTVGPSPPEIASRLEAAGIRPINNVVDATNYAMLEWGHPLHAFDLETLADHRIVVRPAAPGEALVTLDGIQRSLDPAMLLIADVRRPVALAGIMGGAETEIHPFTRTVLLEAASFAPWSVRRTSRRLGLRTEASARFERGIDPEGVLRAARRCARLIARAAGGCVLRGAIDAYPAPAPRPTITLRLARIPRVLGVRVPSDDVVAILSRLGVETSRDGEILRAIPPVGRRDLEREEDVIEEVARHFGYDRIPEAMPVEAMHQGRRPPRLEAESAARDALIRSGLTEAMTVSLIHPRLLERLDLDADDPWRQAVPLANPLTAEHTHLRPCLLPGVLEAARVNVNRRRQAVHLFEMGTIFRASAGGVEEQRALAVAMRGRWLIGDWNASDDGQEVLFYHLKGVLEVLVGELRAGSLSVEAGGPRWLHPARAGRLFIDGTALGVAGELHPAVAERFELPGRTYVAELDLDELLRRAVLQPRFAGLPRFPAVRRDVAVVAPRSLPHAAVEAALRESVGPLLESVELFDVYMGPPLEEGMRNLAYTLTLRAPDRTLTGEEVEEIIRRVHATLPERLPVTIRT
ncbi:MAG: phenylalanine--tRNA ligase subunit beta [Armatimonadetes bacterium]|nr:phenylalanine--tRNA ligase subunit beta [Armatimonadota bacterium]